MAGAGLRYPWERLVYPLGSEPPHRDPNGWVSGQPADQLKAAPMQSYQDLPVIVLLGERGVGKSDIISGEARRLEAEAADCHLVDLPELGSDAPARLARVLGPAQSDTPRFVLLDSLDEAIDGNPGVWQLLAGCLRDLGAEGRSRLRLRIACRSSRWPVRLKDALETIWPGQVSYLGVAGLTRTDVVMAAELNGLDESFVKQLEQRQLVVPLASWPVTLIPLLHSAVQNLPLPGNTVEAFAQACERLCTETNPARRDTLTADHPSPAELLAAGRRVAAALQFGAADTLADLDEGSGLPLPALAGGTEPDIAGREVRCTEHLLRKLTESALLSPLGPRRWGFAHHSFQEFLAAQYLQVYRTPAQVRRALLLAGDGRSRHVVASQREVTAWLAVSDDSLFEEILVCDPEVLLLADLAVRPEADRGRLTDALLRLVREDFTIQLDPLLLYRLDHPDLAGQLCSRLAVDRTPNELYAALMIARACRQPALTGQLMTIAENPEVSEGLRSLAVEAVTLDSPETRSRLLQIIPIAPPDLAGAALARLWPRYMPTADMLNSLPRPRPNRLAAAWGFMHALPRLLRPADLADALAWAARAMSARSGRDHLMLAIEILAWAVRTCELPDAMRRDADADNKVIIQLGEALVSLVRGENFHEPGMPFDKLGSELAGRPPFRRAVARKILHQASAAEVGDLTFSTALGLFPLQDAAYWAHQLPSLTPAAGEKLKFPLRNAPDDPEEWAEIWELAQADDRVRKMTEHWFALPVSHPLADDARRRREAERRDQVRRAALRYDEEALTARLAALTASQAPARPGWFDVIVDLHKNAEGDEVALPVSLDLSSAPSFPPPGSRLHERLIHAAAAVLQNAPVIADDQIDPTRIGLFTVPELCALGLLIQSGHPGPGELEVSRWAGLALALIFVPTVPGDGDLRNHLLATGLQHSGHEIEQALPGLLDLLKRHELTQVMGRLMPVRTSGLTIRLNQWVHSQDRDPGQREAVLDALAEHGDPAVLDELRHTIPLTGPQEDIDPGSPSGQQWLSNASIAARRDTAVSMPAIVAALTAAPALARPLLDRLASDSGLGSWPMDLSVMRTRELTDLYDLITAHGPVSELPLSDESGAVLFGPDQQLQRMRSQLASIIASRGTKQAADELCALAGRHPDHWQPRELARQVSRQVAQQAWRPTGIEDLLKLADDSALRLVRDERQLRDVIIESIERLQHLITRPNGWVILLWHKSKADTSSGWWPVWEEDLSDLVATFLQHDLAERQVIVNREVQILRPRLNGQRTDIHVQATPPRTDPDPEPLTVIIECKGCWNDGLDTDLSGQLVAKYLAKPGRNAGIYLVGYFDCARWDHVQHPGREHPAHELEEVRAGQTRIAREQTAQKSVNVAASILDCRLPTSQAPATP